MLIALLPIRNTKQPIFYKMERTEQIIALRPKITTAKITQEISEIEKFQNVTIRPIIKYQHAIILSMFTNHASKFLKNWEQLSNEKKELFIGNELAKNQKFKNVIKGCIIGFFTETELEIYFQHKTEVNRRIIQIIKQRLVSNLSML